MRVQKKNKVERRRVVDQRVRLHFYSVEGDTFNEWIQSLITQVNHLFPTIDDVGCTFHDGEEPAYLTLTSERDETDLEMDLREKQEGAVQTVEDHERMVLAMLKAKYEGKK